MRSYNNLPFSDELLVEYISWQLDDPTQTALSSDALPTVFPVLEDWGPNFFGLTITGGIPGPYPNDFLIRADVSEEISAILKDLKGF